ncbi:prepilin-type N-terminal cleavage/methylation domain-containing protein, partial [Candidatus Dojkabacteria bacterium]|nr:prepilin-type N-terminal cleavage/methylation domain-containing protein [Candidatus Dojkabacteria bacterium]
MNNKLIVTEFNKDYVLRRAFSLVELLIVMGVIAVLLSITAYGLSVLNRNSRNSQRVEAINQLKIEVEKYYLDNGRYPDTSDFQESGDEIQLCDGNDCTSIESKGGMLNPGSTTDKHTTAFCYNKGTSSYSLGVQIEGSGDWRNVGTDSAGCNDSDLILASTPPQPTLPQGGGGCFLAGTHISLSDGSSKLIENIEPGDSVLSFNHTNNSLDTSTVGFVQSYEVDGYFVINNTLKLTNNHPLYIKKQNGYVGWGAIDPSAAKKEHNLRLETVEQINVGDHLFTSEDQWKEITSIDSVNEKALVYNLEGLSPFQNYFA